MAIVESDIHKYFAASTEDVDLVNYLATLVLTAGIEKPSDLGFLCSGSSGIPKSVQLALDANMQGQALQVLDLACRSQIALKQGVLDLASLQLARTTARAGSGQQTHPTAEPTGKQAL